MPGANRRLRRARSLALWNHQREALRRIARLLDEDQDQDGASLLRLPTGTGKSGVIALSAQTLASGDVLVLAPWSALVDQLRDDISARFWETIGVRPPALKRVVRLYPSTAESLLEDVPDDAKPTIFVATITALQRLLKTQPDVGRRLGHRLELVVVDEGHYEPAPQWAAAVRGLGVRTCLLTATPYRNDFKFFDVDARKCFLLSHAEAEAAGYLRTLRFVQGDWQSPEGFIDQLLATLDNLGQPFRDARVVVRGATQANVQQLTRLLILKARTAIGVHENFSSSSPAYLTSRVPGRDAPGDPQFWVHQFKLIEGIDDPRFRVLAVYVPLRNERAFVQQIGRILRNPGLAGDQEAIVFSHPSHGLDESWRAYRQYDSVATIETLTRGPKTFARELPTSQYINGRFRGPFDMDAANAHDQFNYPLATRVYERPNGLTVAGLEAAVEADWLERDRELGVVAQPDAVTRVHPYVAVENSPLLMRAAFTEYEVGFTIYRFVGDFIFFHDTQGATPPPLADRPPVDVARLQTLFLGTDARLTSVALTNTDLSRYATRRRVLDAVSIGELAPDLADRAHFPTIATGRTTATGPVAQDMVTRYVGLATGRIRDRLARETPYEDYVAWVDELASLLTRSGAMGLPVFERYANVVASPTDTTPMNILLDFDVEAFREAGESGRTLEIDELCLPVESDRFTCVANGTEYEVRVHWDSGREVYELSSDVLDTVYIRRDPSLPGGSETLIAHLNRHQAFRIVLGQADPSYVVYTSGVFVDPRLPVGPGAAAGSLDLLQILTPVARLSTIDVEKGRTGTATGAGWDADSVFGLIDSNAPGTAMAEDLAALDLLVCDDLGTEIADFIGVERARRRVVAIHAKANANPRPLSASALHDVTTQAIKNLAYLQPYFAGDPPNLSRWDDPWADGKAGTVTRRVRRGAEDGVAAWSEIRSVLRDPAATREAWLVIGQGLSRTALSEEQVKPNPTSETIQILYSLQATWSALAGVGCRLRVFCSQ